MNRPSFFALLALLLWSVSVTAAAQGADASCVDDHLLAQAKRQQGSYLEARATALRCARDSCPKLVREDCSAWYVELDASLPSLIFDVRDASGRDLTDARIEANGQVLTQALQGRAITLDPGPYHLRFEAAGHQPIERDLVVREGVKNRPVLAVLTPLSSASLIAPSARTPRPRRFTPPVLTLGAIALVGLGTYAAVGLTGELALRRLDRSHCKPDCSRSEVEHANRMYRAADVAAGAGVAAAIAGAVVYLLGRRDEASADQKLRLEARSQARGADISLRSAF